MAVNAKPAGKLLALILLVATKFSPLLPVKVVPERVRTSVLPIEPLLGPASLKVIPL